MSAVYTIHDEGFEENGAVVGCTGKFINHNCFQFSPGRQLGDWATHEIIGSLMARMGVG
jgi:hypothetical protein